MASDNTTNDTMKQLLDEGLAQHPWRYLQPGESTRAGDRYWYEFFPSGNPPPDNPLKWNEVLTNTRFIERYGSLYPSAHAGREKTPVDALVEDAASRDSLNLLRLHLIRPCRLVPGMEALRWPDKDENITSAGIVVRDSKDSVRWAYPDGRPPQRAICRQPVDHDRPGDMTSVMTVALADTELWQPESRRRSYNCAECDQSQEEVDLRVRVYEGERKLFCDACWSGLEEDDGVHIIQEPVPEKIRGGERKIFILTSSDAWVREICSKLCAHDLDRPWSAGKVWSVISASSDGFRTEAARQFREADRGVFISTFNVMETPVYLGIVDAIYIHQTLLTSSSVTQQAAARAQSQAEFRYVGGGTEGVDEILRLERSANYNVTAKKEKLIPAERARGFAIEDVEPSVVIEQVDANGIVVEEVPVPTPARIDATIRAVPGAETERKVKERLRAGPDGSIINKPDPYVVHRRKLAERQLGIASKIDNLAMTMHLIIQDCEGYDTSRPSIPTSQLRAWRDLLLEIHGLLPDGPPFDDEPSIEPGTWTLDADWRPCPHSKLDSVKGIEKPKPLTISVDNGWDFRD